VTEMVEIHYLRPPDDVQIYRQHLLLDAADVKVTLARAISYPNPHPIAGEVGLEDGSDVVWFTFPGAWHDIGRFHRADGTFTGLYANVLTPPRMPGRVWHTTDLYLDVWRRAGGTLLLLAEDEFDAAVENEHIDQPTAARARQEAASLLAAARAGRWPPPVVEQWTRERALEVLGYQGR